ncbi:MAG: flagellar hook-associated protein FlgK [Bdellovibrionaceae bacterium]|nr:flagellar hook-associated protein FlgK [Pseudobdellovibrionaceae bacterium]
MMNSQTALHTISHNIANKNTEGYSRQKTETFTNFPYGSGKMRVGTGARAASVQRVNNPYLEKQIANETSQMGFLEGRARSLGRLEQVYNEQSTEGLNFTMAKFFNAYRELSTNPESMAMRIAVKESADLLTRDFNRVNEQLADLRGDTNTEVAITVNEINTITQELATLNGQVQKVEISGGYANDERDRRDLLIKKLGQLTDIKWAEGEDRTVTISMGGNAILVTGTEARQLEALATPKNGNKREGDYDVIYHQHEHAQPLVVTDLVKGGKLGGVLQARDSDVKEFQDNIDMVAYELASRVNDLHTQGFTAYNQKGITLFDPIEQQTGASERIRVNAEVLGDVGHIVAGMDPDRPGDNRIANMISDLQHTKSLKDGSVSLDEYYNGMVAELGLRTQKANHLLETQEGVVRQLENFRESMSGVNIDEEVANMIEWQKQFDASARIIRTADEMLDTVLNIKRY